MLASHTCGASQSLGPVLRQNQTAIADESQTHWNSTHRRPELLLSLGLLTAERGHSGEMNDLSPPPQFQGEGRALTAARVLGPKWRDHRAELQTGAGGPGRPRAPSDPPTAARGAPGDGHTAGKE